MDANDRSPQAQGRMLLTGVLLLHYSAGKRWMIETQGRDRETVEAMPVGQVVLSYSLDRFERLRGESFKWFALPYHQAQPRLLEVEQQLRQAAARQEGFPFIQAMPAMSAAYRSFTSLEQRIAALRCVEAIRDYAANHDGNLPASLDAIVDLPIPLDPMTGQPFHYTVDGRTVTLTGGVLPGDRNAHVADYRLTFTGDNP
jgi:hypothetical protein